VCTLLLQSLNQGYDGAEKYYIATQAPLPNTINDFWQMVWEQKTALIVMIGEENEVSHIICYMIHNIICEQNIKYWPDTHELVHQNYGLVTVTVSKRVVKPNYTVTTFRLTHTAVSRAYLIH